MDRIRSPEYLISIMGSGNTVALTAPLIIRDRVLIGFALSPGESQCSALSHNEFQALCSSLYLRVHAPCVYHGLKRIWEDLDQRGLGTDLQPDKDIDINKIDDTRLIAFLLDPDSSDEVKFGDYRVQEQLTLAHVAYQYLGHDYPYRITEIVDRASLGLAAEILAHDAGLIWELGEKLPSLMSSDLHKLYRNLELPLMLVLDDMRRVGIGFDGAACAELVKETERSMAALAQEITGAASVDLTAHEDVYRFLIDQGIPLKVSPAQLKRGGLKKPLEEIAQAYPVVRKILAWWDMGTELGFLRRWAGHDRIHPVWGQIRSATSRIYARNPAVQNVSRRLRHLFVPPPGHVLIKADYSQAQMRILAHLSQDPELIRIFNDPKGDVHTETSEWLGLYDRNVAKEINFAICFGMGPSALAQKINELKERQDTVDLIDEATARSYIDGFYERFPKVKEFFAREWKKMKKLPARARVVRSLLGRERRFLRRPYSETERQFRVTWPQQIEADLMKTAMVRLDRIFRRRNTRARIVMMIHDALWIEAYEVEADRVRDLLKTAMTDAGEMDVPLEVDMD
jgi:DNA polymerase-1